MEINQMKTLTHNQTWLIGGLLLLVLITTRSHILLSHIQDASWAIFFLVGFYLRSYLGLPIFLLVAFVVDMLVIQSKGGESFCFTVSYPLLIPAYGSLWLAGRWFANHYSEDLRGLFYFVASAVVGVAVCVIISSGGFYWFSGRFADVNFAEMVRRIAIFMPMFLKTTMMYLSIAAVIHFAVIQANKLSSHSNTKHS